MRSLSVVIATYQRRNPLSRLLDTLRAQLDEPGLSEALDVIVVVDGSTDGTMELCESIDFPVALKPIWQPNHGRAAARNVGLGLAGGEVVWFLDDDVVALPGLLRRHRLSHEDSPPHVMMGPHLVGAPPQAIAPNQKWVDLIYGEMAESGLVNRASRFSTANASGDTDVFRGVGGFDEGFTGWGFEDTEIGQRILRAGYEIRFDPRARASHIQDLTVQQFCQNNVSAGRGLCRVIRLHPELLDELVPHHTAVPSRRTARAVAGALYRHFPLRSPIVYRVVASAACALARLEGPVSRNRSQRALYIAMVASTLAGIAEADPDGTLLPRKFGIVEPS
jgi:GT2 family glycosyltransferase